MTVHKRIPMEALSELLLLQMEKGGRAHLTVTGGSMLPMLRPSRDAVELIAPTGERKKGDIILYRRASGAFVLHRIIALKDGGYICCGDNQAEKEPVAPEQMLAVVDGYIRKGKKRRIDGFGYRLYKGLWVGAFPLRRLYIAIRRPLGKLYRKCKGNKPE